MLDEILLRRTKTNRADDIQVWLKEISCDAIREEKRRREKKRVEKNRKEQKRDEKRIHGERKEELIKFSLNDSIV